MVPAWVNASLSGTLQPHPPLPDSAWHGCSVSHGVKKLEKKSETQTERKADKGWRGAAKTKLAGVALSGAKIETIVNAKLVAHRLPVFIRLPVVANTHVPAQQGCCRRETGTPSWTDAKMLRAPPPPRIPCPTRGRGIDVDFVHLTEEKRSHSKERTSDVDRKEAAEAARTGLTGVKGNGSSEMEQAHEQDQTTLLRAVNVPPSNPFGTSLHDQCRETYASGE